MCKYLRTEDRETMTIRNKKFFDSDEAISLRKILVCMAESDEYNTRSMYSTLDKNGLTFVDKHMNYMSQYPNLNHSQYVLNLKLMTKIR